jgi:16S rRNA (uracil1498-N3)-methyltransferase
LLEGFVAQLQRLAITPEQCIQDTVALTPDQQHYLTRVLRLKSGDRFIALLEQDCWRLAELQLGQSARLLEALLVQSELAQPITLYAALMRQGFEEVVRAATELGVAQLVPILSSRTMVHPSDQKLSRWRRIAAEAAEQSCRQTVPPILAPLSFDAALDRVPYSLQPSQPSSDAMPSTAEVHRLICVTDAEAPNLLRTLEKLPKLGILIMVGPEGGWTPAEQSLAISQGFLPVSLGHRVLRAVTASVAAVSVLASYIDAAQQ